MSYQILIHWGRVTHICVGCLTIIGSDNGLSRPQCFKLSLAIDGFYSSALVTLRCMISHYNDTTVSLQFYLYNENTKGQGPENETFTRMGHYYLSRDVLRSLWQVVMTMIDAFNEQQSKLHNCVSKFVKFRKHNFFASYLYEVNIETVFLFHIKSSCYMDLSKLANGYFCVLYWEIRFLLHMFLIHISANCLIWVYL